MRSLAKGRASLERPTRDGMTICEKPREFLLHERPADEPAEGARTRSHDGVSFSKAPGASCQSNTASADAGMREVATNVIARARSFAFGITRAARCGQ